jgi:hypothetical protein
MEDEMGFVYNNTSEAMCTTFLEMNGFFVINNLRPFILDEGETRFAFEADLVALKPPGTCILGPEMRNDNSNPQELYAGDNGASGLLIYCEIKADFTLNDSQRPIRELLSDDGIKKLRDKQSRLKTRYPSLVPEVAIFAHYIAKNHKETMAKLGWKYKEFPGIFAFMENRFHKHRDAKSRVQYNDPWLDMLKVHGAVGIPKERGLATARDR